MSHVKQAILTTKRDQITREDKESLIRRIQALLENLMLRKNLTSKQKTKNKKVLQA